MIRKLAIALAWIVIMPGTVASLAQDQPAAANNTQEAGQGGVAAPPLWLMSCSNQMQPEQLLCEFSQSIVFTQGNQSQRVATASFNRVAGQPETNALFTLPYGVSLPEPVRILVDDQELGVLEWQSCDLGGCYATGTVDEEWLQGMRAGQNLTAALKGQDGRDLSFSFQLNGFTKAEGMLP